MVVLIGGAPGAGKTTLSRALAARLDAVSQTADNLQYAATAVTSPETHPGLHSMTRAVTGVDSVEYFTAGPVERLIADANSQHEAVWPAIRSVIRKHTRDGPSIVIDGWYMRPEWVKALDLDAVTSFWLVTDPNVLAERERSKDFFQRSSDPERMLKNFLGRSFWYNDLIKQEAGKLGMTLLHQDGTKSVDALCDMALNHINGAN